MSKTNFILVTGGVISGLGKGIIASSIGTCLKAMNVNVTMIKIDPYINIDAGTFSPYEHGEVYVLDDGGEVDLERDNNITTGKIYESVIRKERRGDYLGKTVQVVPHLTNEIQEKVESVANRSLDVLRPNVCIIELGGTIGDIEGMAFVEAFRQFKFKIGDDSFCCVHCSLAPEAGGEYKTKPTQASVRELRGLGLNPDFVFVRSNNEIEQSIREKISMFTNVDVDHVLSIPNVQSLYRVPLILETQGFITMVSKRLSLNLPPLNKPRELLAKWRELCSRTETLSSEVLISIVGKYTKIGSEAYLSITKALEHAATACNHKIRIEFIEASHLENQTQLENPLTYHLAWQKLCDSQGVLIPGGFGERGIEGKIAACKWSREKGTPLLGICLGMQVAVIEYCRNVLNLPDANSTEFNAATANPVVVDMPEHTNGDMGGTMRLGRRRTIFYKEKSSILRKLYGEVEHIDERHRHRYEVNKNMVEALESKGMMFVGHDIENERMEVLEVADQPYYVGVQYHPEYLSRPLKPSAPFIGLILASTGKLKEFLALGCRFSPRSFSFNGDEELNSNDSVSELRRSLSSGLFALESNQSK